MSDKRPLISVDVDIDRFPECGIACAFSGEGIAQVGSYEPFGCIIVGIEPSGVEIATLGLEDEYIQWPGRFIVVAAGEIAVFRFPYVDSLVFVLLAYAVRGITSLRYHNSLRRQIQ